jgi:hypothetical protein
MDRKARARLVGAVLLLLLGVGLLLLRFMPGLRRIITFTWSWPWSIVGVGALLFFLGLLLGPPASWQASAASYTTRTRPGTG